MDTEEIILSGVVAVVVLVAMTYEPVKKTYVFKPEPTEIHENNSEICYGWKYTDRYHNEKLVRICEGK